MKTEEENREQKICFYEETNFKNTELGEIPKDWEVVKLCGLIVDEMNGDWGKGVKENPDFTECFVLRGTDFQKVANGDFEEVPIRFLKGSSLIKRRLQDGDVLVELSGGGEKQPTGRVLLARRNWLEKVHLPVVFSNFVKRIRISDSVCFSEYFYLYWKLLYQNKKTSLYERRTTGIRNFKYKDFVQNESIPLPPVEEQKAIAYVLSAVQEAREKTEKVIEAAKELKKSLMKHLFTYGPVSLEEADRINLKETEIGLIPESWEVAKLGEMQAKGFLKLKNGLAQGNWNDEGNGIPQIRPFNITEDGRITLQAVKYIQPFDNIKDYKLHLGDVIFDNTNSEELVGKTAYWNIEGDFTLSNHMTIIRVLKREIVNPVFLSSYLHKNWTDKVYLRIRRRYVNQASVTLTVLKELSIPLPPLAVQQRIAEILQTVDEKIQAEEKKKQALDNLFNSMLHMLMSGKLRVKFRTGEEEESG